MSGTNLSRGCPIYITERHSFWVRVYFFNSISNCGKFITVKELDLTKRVFAVPIKSKFFWGFLAGILIVFVKILGPDKLYVRSLFEGESLGGISFYIFISIITIFIGAISGLFSREKEPVKLLIFCASVPALLTTVTTEQRGPAVNGATSGAESIQASTDPSYLPSIFVSSAFAQSSSKKHVCDEGGFFRSFSQTGAQYLSGGKRSDLPYYGVVVASTNDFEKAQAIANEIYSKDTNLTPFVGCRKPGNELYPVMVGEVGTQIAAAEWMGRYREAQLLLEKPYLSFYEYRVPIYTPR